MRIKYTVSVKQDLAGYFALVMVGLRVAHGTGYFKTDGEALLAGREWAKSH